MHFNTKFTEKTGKKFPLATTFSMYLTCILHKLNVSYITTTQLMSPWIFHLKFRNKRFLNFKAPALNYKCVGFVAQPTVRRAKNNETKNDQPQQTTIAASCIDHSKRNTTKTTRISQQVYILVLYFFANLSFMSLLFLPTKMQYESYIKPQTLELISFRNNCQLV